MKKLFGTFWLVVGVALFSCALNAYLSPVSQMNRMILGVPTDNTLWYTIGSLLAVITGIFNFSESEMSGTTRRGFSN